MRALLGSYMLANSVTSVKGTAVRFETTLHGQNRHFANVFTAYNMDGEIHLHHSIHVSVLWRIKEGSFSSAWLMYVLRRHAPLMCIFRHPCHGVPSFVGRDSHDVWNHLKPLLPPPPHTLSHSLSSLGSDITTNWGTERLFFPGEKKKLYNTSQAASECSLYFSYPQTGLREREALSDNRYLNKVTLILSQR